MITAATSESSSLRAELNLGYVWLISSVAALGGLLFGWDWVVIGGAKPFFQSYFQLTSATEIGWANSCALIGCLVGALVAGGLSDKFGRKRLLILSAFLFAVTSLGNALAGKPSHIETGRWYDLKLTVARNHVKCWLDGQLLHDVDFGGGKIVKALYATAATDALTGDVIVKVVNAAAQPLETEVDFSGASKLSGKGTATVLTSESAADENSLTEPLKVSPKMEAVSFTGTSLKRSFPGNSFTVLRLQSQ